jgi:hypothetical protein
MWNPKNGRYSDYIGDAEDNECVLEPIWDNRYLLDNTEQMTLANQMQDAINNECKDDRLKDFQEEFSSLAIDEIPF